MNCNGTIDSFGVDPFVLAMTNLYGQGGYYEQYPTCNHLNGDLNGDGAVDSFDLDLFTALLTGSAGASGLRFEYAWDAENRLTRHEPAGTLQVDDIKVELAYDYMGRRVRKQVYEWDGSEWDLAADTKFVWGGTGGSSASGWLLLLELDALDQDTVVRKYTWGLDLAGMSGQSRDRQRAGMLESAGGIGGLLAVDQAAIDYPDPKPDISAGQYVYLHDANGNVGQLVAWASGYGGATGDEWHADRLVAHYEYDPYGNAVNQTGDYAEENPFRFSTKYWDDETGLASWPLRPYAPRTGRWLNRDPIAEGAELNLYRFVANAPILWVDALGLLTISPVTGLNARGTGTFMIEACACYLSIKELPSGRWQWWMWRQPTQVKMRVTFQQLIRSGDRFEVVADNERKVVTSSARRQVTWINAIISGRQFNVKEKQGAAAPLVPMNVGGHVIWHRITYNVGQRGRTNAIRGGRPSLILKLPNLEVEGGISGGPSLSAPWERMPAPSSELFNPRYVYWDFGTSSDYWFDTLRIGVSWTLKLDSAMLMPALPGALKHQIRIGGMP